MRNRRLKRKLSNNQVDRTNDFMVHLYKNSFWYNDIISVETLHPDEVLESYTFHNYTGIKTKYGFYVEGKSKYEVIEIIERFKLDMMKRRK